MTELLEGAAISILRPPRLCERDIDLLLAEEFRVSNAFAKWFLSIECLSHLSGGKVVGIDVSKAHALGESDLVVLFANPDSGEKFAIFIEDKIDAPLQPEQVARYRKRAEEGKLSGEYGEFKIVLCSPAAYIASSGDGFDAKVSYEAIAAFLRSSEPGVRSAYRADAILLAAKSARTPLATKEFDEVTTAFWAAAYEIAWKEFPELEMKRISKPVKGQTWATFQTSYMPKQPVSIVLFLNGDKGSAQLNFAGIDPDKLSAHVTPLLSSGMSTRPSGKTALLISMRFVAFGITPFDEEAAAGVRAALQVCVSLVRFYRDHKLELDFAANQALVAPKPLAFS